MRAILKSNLIFSILSIIDKAAFFEGAKVGLKKSHHDVALGFLYQDQ